MKKSELRQMIREELMLEKFPKKAVDLNKVEDSDAFWKWSLDDAKKHAGTSLNRAKEIGDLILFLNMAASAWKRK